MMSYQNKNKSEKPWFAYRGAKVCDVNNVWRNTTFVKKLSEEEYKTGDGFLMALAVGWKSDAELRKLAERNGKPLGLTKDGHISFADLFERLLEYRHMRMETATGTPCGITEAGYANAIKTLPRNVQGALLMGTHLVAKMSLCIRREVVEVKILYHDIPCLGANGDVVTCPSRSTEITIPRVRRKDGKPLDKVEDVVLKFLTFAMSMGKFSFPNICHVEICVVIRGVTGKIFDVPVAMFKEEYAKKGTYAVPRLDFASYGTEVRLGLLRYTLRYAGDRCTPDFLGALSSCKYQPSFFGKTDNHYFGDYLVQSSMSTPFEYGTCVEETAINCINYCQEKHWGPLYDTPSVIGIVNKNETESSRATSSVPNTVLSDNTEYKPEPAKEIKSFLTSEQVETINNIDWSEAESEDSKESAYANAVEVAEFSETLSEIKHAYGELFAVYERYRSEYIDCSGVRINWDDTESLLIAIREFTEEQNFNAVALKQSNNKEIRHLGSSMEDTLDDFEKYAIGWCELDWAKSGATQKHFGYQGRLRGFMSTLERMVKSGDGVLSKISVGN